ncbi:MAG: haloacid dehalogenase-like hydrolase [Methanomicrobia archaeon]|nr:haloacid dehalogenase-like hydrolase [Methanomicrobia archaeon]
MIVCFDLEGPISPQDNAYELMKLIPNGDEIFSKISRYDDILALKKKDYEAGYTLALILPFLISHKINEDDIEGVSEKAKINEGAKELVSRLKKRHKFYIISTSYEQHAYSIGKRIGVPKENIYCTAFPINDYLYYDIDLQKTEKQIIDLNNNGIEEFFNEFYETLDDTMKKIIENTKVIGGKYKTEAIYKVLEREKEDIKNVVAVGDSITDFKMLKNIKERGGISIVFNGNEYAIPYAEFAFAGTTLLPLASFIESRNKKEFIEKWEGKGHFHYVGENTEKIISIHKKFRNIMRGKAGELG